MKNSSILFPSLLPFLIGLLPLSLTRAEDAATKFASGVKVEVKITRPSRTGGGDYDDKFQIINTLVKMVNTTTNQDYSDYKAVYMVVGESTMNRKIIKVLLREEFPVAITARETFERETGSVETRFDTTDAKFGYKYDGWIVQVTDSKGEVVYTKSTSSTYEKMPREVQSMKAHAFYDKKLKQVTEPSLIMRR